MRVAGDFFNQNLQLDTVAPHIGIGGGSRPSSGFRGGIREDPDFVRRILGSTVAGREMRMGERGNRLKLSVI